MQAQIKRFIFLLLLAGILLQYESFAQQKEPNKKTEVYDTPVLHGAHERNRTFTPLRTADFESAASTNSATWASFCSKVQRCKPMKLLKPFKSLNLLNFLPPAGNITLITQPFQNPV